MSCPRRRAFRAILTARRHRSEAHMSPRLPPRRQVGHPWRKGSVKWPWCLLPITTVYIYLKYVQEGGDFPFIIEIDLMFHLQLSKPGWPIFLQCDLDKFSKLRHGACPLCDSEDKEKVAVSGNNERARNTRHPRYKIYRRDIYSKTGVEHSHLTHQWSSQSNLGLLWRNLKNCPGSIKKPWSGVRLSIVPLSGTLPPIKIYIS